MFAFGTNHHPACDAARPDLEQQFNGNPEASLWRLAGLALVQCGLSQNRPAETAIVLDKLQKAFPDDADVLYETAKVHMKAWNDAVFQMYQKTPASFRVNQLSGEIFEIQGRYQDAAAEYRKAIQKNPAALNLHFRLGRALLLPRALTDMDRGSTKPTDLRPVAYCAPAALPAINRVRSACVH